VKEHPSGSRGSQHAVRGASFKTKTLAHLSESTIH